MKNLSTLCPGKDFNWAPLAYKSQALIGSILLDKAMFISFRSGVYCRNVTMLASLASTPVLNMIYT
jgi:hypothetical protein